MSMSKCTIALKTLMFYGLHSSGNSDPEAQLVVFYGKLPNFGLKFYKPDMQFRWYNQRVELRRRVHVGLNKDEARTAPCSSTA